MFYLRKLLLLVFSFGKNVWGTFNKPYSTYRHLTHEDPLQLLIMWGFIGAYFFLVSPLKIHTFHPFLLTINATRLFTMALTSYIGICLFLMVMSKLLTQTTNLKAILLAWGHSLTPTLMWFFTTSVFYVILPPPRHETWLGRIFSILFITFSISLLVWKGILYYLTLRFALKLDLLKIVGVSMSFLPILALLPAAAMIA